MPDNDPAKPPGAHVHRTIAASTPGMYYYWNAKGTAAYSWRDDPFQSRLTINSSSAIAEAPIDRAYNVISLKPDDPLPESAPREFLFAAFGWWPFENRPAPLLEGATPSVLREIARSPKYVVKPLQERLDGRWCHVLEYPGHDRLWLDCERNATMLAREILDSKTGALLQRIEMREHLQVKPGIWVPMEIRNILFDAHSAKNSPRKLVDSVVKVLRVQVNDPFPDTLFKFKPAPGSIQMSSDGLFEQKVPGGTDHLDEIIAWMQRNGKSTRTSTSGSGTSVEAAVEYALSTICVVAIVVLHWRKRTQRP